MRTFFITSISIHYNKWIITFRFNHHAMKIYKSYYTGRGKNTNKIFLKSSLVFSAKKFTIVLIEIPSISNKFVLQMILVLLLYLLFFLLSNLLFLLLSIFFLFFYHQIFVLFLYHQKKFFLFLYYQKRFIQVLADHILCICLTRSLQDQIGAVFYFFCF